MRTSTPLRAAEGADWDVVTYGETMLRLSPELASSLEDADNLHLHVAGSESNTAVALARLGVRVAWGSRLHSAGPGRRIAAELRRWQVDLSQVIWEPEETGRTGLFFLESGSAPRTTSVLYDRANSSAARLQPGDADELALQAARILHLTGITPALSSSCAAFTLQTAVKAKSAGTFVSFDVNYRSRLWSAAAARDTLAELYQYIDLLVCTQEDAALLYGLNGSGNEVATDLCATLGVPAAVVTCGADGAYASAAGRQYYAPGLAIGSLVGRVGAGDAFAAGLLYGILHGDVQMGLQYGMAMAALKHGYAGDILLATREEIIQVVNGSLGGLKR